MALLCYDYEFSLSIQRFQAQASLSLISNCSTLASNGQQAFVITGNQSVTSVGEYFPSFFTKLKGIQGVTHCSRQHQSISSHLV